MMKNILIIFVLCLFVSCNYKVKDSKINESTIVLNLEYTGSDSYYIKPTSPIYKNLKLTLVCQSEYDLYFKITDVDSTRFEIPQYAPFPVDPLLKETYPLNQSEFVVTFTETPFSLKIVRKSTNELLFDSSVGDLVFSSHYIQISTQVASRYAWGFGERFSNKFKIVKGKYTIFNRDRPGQIDNQNGHQTYGHYPIYFLKDNSSNFHLNYFRNSNAMDIIVNQTPDNTYSFTYKTIGGIIDFRFIVGKESPDETISKFHHLIGQPAVPPFWSLGFHQCRWGYKNISQLQDVTLGYQNDDIPLDTIWSDIDYMVDYEDFTIDQTRFNLQKMQDLLKNYHYIPIIDAGIKINNGTAYKEGVKRGVFIKDAVGQQYQGSVWPGPTAFVDFFHPNATQYWGDMLNMLYEKVKFSGIWLDMNELANFCEGPCKQIKNQTGFDYSKDLPYTPGSDTNIESHTISLNATRYGNLTEADVHAYSGFWETYATSQFLASKNLRPFIISRSTAPGSGKYGYHWTGDNVATFDYLKNSIAQNFLFQIWGIQMVGADICGFGQNTTQQLCARWFQLGAFYPFSRNHNELDAKSQEAYSLGKNVLKASQVNLKLRYSLLKSYYRHFVANKGYGAIYKPLFFNYPKDKNVYSDDISQTQFMLGDELMFAPVVEKGAVGRSIYFPGTFYNFHYGNRFVGPATYNMTNIVVDPILTFIAEGHGVFVQDVTNVTKTSQLNNVFQLNAGLKYDQNASTEQVSVYVAKSYLLGIQNYNNQTKVSLCITSGCQYQLIWTLSVNQSRHQILKLQCSYTGTPTLNQKQIITRATLRYENKSIFYKFIQPIEITESFQQVFDIDSVNIQQEVTQ